MARRKERERRRLSAKKRAHDRLSGFDRTAIAVPDGVKLFSLTREGTKRIEIIPFVAGVGNPGTDKGSLYYERTYFSHPRIGANEDTYICLRKTFGKACPVCEQLSILSQDPDADEKAVKALIPKERQLWNVFDHDERDKGVQLWDITFHWFGKLLYTRIDNQDEDEEFEFFADPEDGQTLRLTVSESTFKNKYEVSAIDFKPRKGPIDDELLEQALCLDDLIIELPYDKLKAIFLQTEEQEEVEEEEEEGKRPKKPRGGGRRKAKEEPEDDDWEDLEGPPKKSRSRKPKQEPEPEDDDDDFDDDLDDDWEDDEEEEEEPPKKTRDRPERSRRSK